MIKNATIRTKLIYIFINIIKSKKITMKTIECYIAILSLSLYQLSPYLALFPAASQSLPNATNSSDTLCFSTINGQQRMSRYLLGTVIHYWAYR